MLRIIALYLCTGVLCFAMVAFMHVYGAARQGYKSFEYWDLALPQIESKITPLQLIWSMLIWPVRMIQFLALIDTFYDIYEHCEKKGMFKEEA